MSPAKSRSQFRKMFQLFRENKITKAQLDRYVGSVDYESLPKKVKAKKPKKRKR